MPPRPRPRNNRGRAGGPNPFTQRMRPKFQSSNQNSTQQRLEPNALQRTVFNEEVVGFAPGHAHRSSSMLRPNHNFRRTPFINPFAPYVEPSSSGASGPTNIPSSSSVFTHHPNPFIPYLEMLSTGMNQGGPIGGIPLLQAGIFGRPTNMMLTRNAEMMGISQVGIFGPKPLDNFGDCFRLPAGLNQQTDGFRTAIMPQSGGGSFHGIQRNSVRAGAGRPGGPVANASVGRIKQQLCKNYFSARGCGKRKLCKFMHEDFPCWLHHVRGNCTEGSNCKFSHQDLNPMTRRVLVRNMVRCSDLFPRMTYKEVHAAITKVELERCRANDDDDDVIMINDDSGAVVTKDDAPGIQSCANPAPTIGDVDVPVAKQGINYKSPTSSSHPSFSRNNESRNENPGSRAAVSKEGHDHSGERPSVHEVVQIMRRAIHQNELMRRFEENNDASTSSVRIFTADSQHAPLFSAITQPLVCTGMQREQGKTTMDSVIASCVGHGPPFTIWQTCMIYNTCAQFGLNLKMSDIQSLHISHT